ncbi:type II toxin-antitoxin system RelE/ParE family toxin [Acidobacteriota bacterium]
MIYNAIWHEDALKDLQKLDRLDAKKIVEKVKAHLLLDPGKYGIPLKGALKGLYRYRFGKYRVIYAIDFQEREILVLFINHRKDIYRKTRRR